MNQPLWAAALALTATAASADGTWTLGLLADGTSGVYIGQDDDVNGLPYIAYDTDRLHIGIDGVSYQIYQDDWGTLDVVLDYRFAPDFPTGDAMFDGLSRDDAVEAGIDAELAFGDAYVGFEALVDVSDTHNGTQARARLGYTLEGPRWEVDAAVGAMFRNASLNQYLYGVTAAEATASRSAFAAQDTTTGFAQLSGAFAITDSTFAVAQINYDVLGSNANSPLVDMDEVYGVTLGLVTQF